MPEPPKAVQVTSTAYANGQRIPDKHTCSGADVSPPLRLEGIPPGTKLLAIIMDDPDAPRGTWTHWTAWDLPSASTIPEGVKIGALGGREGRTDFGRTGYGGPCPPPGKPHRYFLKVYALREPLKLANGASLADVNHALTGKVLAWGELMGTFSR